MTFSEFCKSVGIDPAALTDAQFRFLRESHDKISAAEGESESEPQRQAEEDNLPLHDVDATFRRISEIEARCGDNFGICARALEGDWTDPEIDSALLSDYYRPHLIEPLMIKAVPARPAIAN